jgi:cob(I)alamin adenosyltransferase
MQRKKAPNSHFSITTRRGDKGTTALIDSSRVSKADLRPEAYGTLDEASSFLGLAKAMAGTARLRSDLARIQDQLSILNSELASPPGREKKLKRRLGRAHLLFLEKVERRIEAGLDLPRKFVLYGGTEASAVLDVARAVVRRAERAVVRLDARDPLPNPHILTYLNRLSDLLFLFARKVESDSGVIPPHTGEV